MPNPVRYLRVVAVPSGKSFVTGISATAPGDLGWIDIPTTQGTIGAMYVGAGADGSVLYTDNNGSNQVIVESGLRSGSTVIFDPATNIVRIYIIKDL